MIDFTKKLGTKEVSKKINPIEIYDTLDRRSETGPLRPAQRSILEKWYQDSTDKRDLVIKLHTGEGKTLIGLLILQSKLNKGEGPCLYICPNIYLVQQVCEEAQKFGINYCVIPNSNEIPDDFLSGKKILITHAHKVFNGMSVFGLNNQYTKVGTVILDDSHACIDVIKDAFSIQIEKTKNERLYNSILSLFEDDLRDQGEGSFIDIQTENYDTLMAVPYWSWYDKKTEVLKLLSSNLEDAQVKYTWPLLKDSIDNYSCYITGNKIELCPYRTDIDVFSSFSKSKNRILMSATTQEDSFFVKGLDFSVEAVEMPLKNDQQKWSGEKMIILPSLIDDECDRDLIVTKFSQMKTQRFGIVAIVPSTKKAAQYQNLGATVANKKDIFDQIKKLKKGEFENVVVINNRYDGIDLPDESCRVLIIDSMPYFEDLSDRYEERCRPNSEVINKKLAQKIEQGIGRGVRGEKDYCALLIIGADIIKFMRSVATNKYFSAQTKKQIELGLSIAEMAREDQEENVEPIKIVVSLIKQSLNRDEGWKAYYTSEMDGIQEIPIDKTIYEKLSLERKIEQLYYNGEVIIACDAMQKFIDESCDDPLEKGWYLQQLARYTYIYQKDHSNTLQKAAFKMNKQLLKPKEGIEYTKVSYINENRLNRIKTFINKFKDFDELQLEVNAILDNLSFGIESDKFEEALQSVGEFLGFISQRPDKEIRKGPDNLWCGVDDQYLIFECKNEVDDNRGEINKHEAGQMNSHCAWFEEEYGTNARVQRFLIIPTKNLSYYGNFTHDVKIIRKGKLRDLRKNIKGFVRELSPFVLSDISDESLQRFLKTHKLELMDLKQEYSEPYYHKTK
ncbi:TPA: DEAD/DEAH box helicase [Streptococcus suis]